MTFPKDSGFFALVSLFDFHPFVHTFCLRFALLLSFISFLKVVSVEEGKKNRAGVSLN